MAYRQLCAVTFVLLGGVVACGGDTTGGSAKATTTDQQPPNNAADRAPNNTADQAPNSGSDPAPSNPDAPPSTSDTPAGSGGGGRLGALCQQLCARVAQTADDCSGNMNIFGMEDFCKDAGTCEVPANVPCEDEIAGLFDCLLGLGSFCTGDQNQDEANQCAEASKQFAACEKTQTQTPVDDTPKGCYAAGGCECANDCLKCSCKAGTDADKLSACLQSDDCTNP